MFFHKFLEVPLPSKMPLYHRQPQLRPYIGKPQELYKKEVAPPGEVEEEVKNPEGEGSTFIADELAVSSNLSQAESLLKQAEASGGDSNLEAINVVKAGLRVAERRVTGQVHLVVDGQGEGEPLDSQLKGLLPVTVRGDEESKSFVAIVIDAKILCESGSQAKYRVPPTRGPHVQRLFGWLPFNTGRWGFGRR